MAPSAPLRSPSQHPTELRILPWWWEHGYGDTTVFKLKFDTKQNLNGLPQTWTWCQCVWFFSRVDPYGPHIYILLLLLLYYIILYYIILWYFILYYILYYVILCNIIYIYIILCYFILYYLYIYYIVLFYIILYYNILYILYIYYIYNII